jgi:hypothetical protein
MASTMELHLPHVVVGGRHLSYYIAIGALLFVGWLLFSKRQKHVDVPFYKAAKTKWMFDAETLILDSYTKVRSTLLPPSSLGLRCRTMSAGLTPWRLFGLRFR